MSIRPFSLTLLAGMTCALTSCFQATNDNAINADGSGKFTIKTTIDLSALQGVLPGGADAAGGGGPGDDMLISVLAGTQGVDVWKDAKSVKGADGKVTVTASGYFKDVTKFKASNPMESMGGGKASASGPSLGDIQSSKDADGNWVIEVPLGKPGDKKADAPAEPAAKLSKEEIADKVTEMRTQFGAMKPMMQAMMGTMKIGQTIKVGGTIKDYGIFTKVDEHTAKMEISFAKIFDGMEKLIVDLHGIHLSGTHKINYAPTGDARAAEQRNNPPMAQPVVRVHPETGRKALYLGEKVKRFEGMTEEESQPLIQYLNAHATKSEFLYRRQWRKNDIVVWDNRCTMHQALGDFDETQRRHMERTTVLGTPSGYAVMGG